MKQTAIQEPSKDEHSEQTNIYSKSTSLDFVVAATQILTIMCLIKGNPAWKGSLALLFIGAASSLFYKYNQYQKKPYILASIVLGLIGVVLFVWFGITE